MASSCSSVADPGSNWLLFSYCFLPFAGLDCFFHPKELYEGVAFQRNDFAKNHFIPHVIESKKGL